MIKEKYIPGPAAFFAVDPGNFIVYNFLTKKISKITKTKAYKYSQLSGIKTIDQHKKNQVNQSESISTINDYDYLFSTFIKNKLLCPLSFFKDSNKNLDTNYTITFITSNRPELLTNALNSLAEKIYINHKDLPIMVFDDSSEPEITEINKSLSNEIKNKFGIKTFYFGIKEKLQFIDLLNSKTEGKIINKDILKFAILGFQQNSPLKGPGGNRNTALLKLAGKKVISFDDDIQYRFVTHPEINHDMEIAYLKDPEGDLFLNIFRAGDKIINSEIDPIGYIKEILGKSIKTLIKKTEINNGTLFTDNFRPEPVFSLANQESSIKAAIFGIYGGRWYSSPFGIYFKNNPDKIVFKKKSEYTSIKEKPVSLMLPHRLTLSRAPFFVATAMGMDAGNILPPFPPYGRNQDGIWAAVMLALNQNAFISHIPIAIYHEMSNKNIFTNDDYKDASVGFGIITVLLIEHCRKKLISLYSKATYETLGNQLFNISQITDKHFISLCHELWLDYTGNTICNIEKKLTDNKRKPKHWAEDMDKFIDLLEKQSLDPGNALPRELRDNYPIEKTIRIYKLFFKDYGNLLKSWPIIWEEAFNLNIEKEN